MMGRRGHGRQQKIVVKSKDTKKAFLRLIQYVRPYRGLMIIAIIFSIAGTFFDIFGPYIMGLTTTYVFDSVKNNTLFENSIRFVYLL